MSSKHLFPLALLLIFLGLESPPVASASLVHHLLPHISHIQRTSDVQETYLIQKACHGVGDYESDCLSTLQSSAPHQKNDPSGLAFFTLRFVEDQAANLSYRIKTFAATPDLPPALQSALSECMDQYNPVDDLIEDAINAVLANVHSDAEKFMDAAIANIVACDSQIKSIHFDDEKSGEEDVRIAKDVSASNDFFRNMLSAAFNILYKFSIFFNLVRIRTTDGSRELLRPACRNGILQMAFHDLLLFYFPGTGKIIAYASISLPYLFA